MHPAPPAADASTAPAQDAAVPEVCRGHVCQAHASCHADSGAPVCACDSGYQDSDQNGTCIEDCSPSICGQHGQCSAVSGSPVCTCDAGWSGDSCDTADCAAFDCNHHGSCDTSSGVAACSCELGWSGPHCSTADCSGVTCTDRGRCDASSGAPLCLCDPGWSGAECTQPDCAAVSCSDNGTCNTNSGAARCVCAPGWSGADCATPDCESVSCVHGSCSTSSGQAACGCLPGWSGDDCATADCSAIACSHHGSCSTTSGVAACSCALGWSGSSCASPDCTGITCAHGSCNTAAGVAACVCDVNWTDAACSTPTCKGYSCSAHGVCGTLSGSAACSCASGWSGAHCEVADCAGITCSGHGTCATTTGSAACTCATGWTGSDCATPTCAGIGCSGHGSCGTSTGSAQCTCATGWTGSDCATPTCAGIGCSGHGSCSTSSGAAVCSCNAGWSGTDCDAAACGNFSCFHGGSCSTGSGAATCSCTTGWSGSDCNTADCTGIDCSGHGSCGTTSGSAACTCAPGWSGSDCATPDCASFSCNGHGTCSTGGGAAACSCSVGWTGANCGTATCAGVTCGTNSTCTTASGSAVCACDSGYGGDLCDFKIVYGLDLPVQPDWRSATNVAYDVDHSTNPALFDRVAYRLQLDGTYVWVELDAFTTDRKKLGVPSDWTWDQTVNDLTVRTNSTALSPVSHSSGGKMEFWSNCYAPGLNGVFDYEDDIDLARPDCHGSMQLFDGQTTLFAMNGWAALGPLDLGIGTNPQGEPDWTFAANAASYTQRRLEVYVRERASCTAVACNGHGSCDASSGAAVCSCTSGWSGSDCTAPDCTGIDCSSHGTCGTGGGTAACSCSSGWSGFDCSTASCSGIACSGHGTCGTGGGVAACSCSSGWSGADCSAPDCTGILCSGHGSCGTGGGVAACSCSSGWSGADCSTPSCSGILCSGHGTCGTGGGVAACSCSSGWSGSDCSTPTCSGITCSGHGTCGTGGGVAACSCASGWSGSDCSTPTCSGITCSGHGSCGTGGGVAACSCSSGWTGSDCSTATCTGITCSGHGTCGTGGGVAACSCATGWSGSDCSTPTCSGIGCSGHGSCSTTSGSAQCTCASGWSSSDCSAPSCTGVTCGTHQVCSTASGTASCGCDNTHAGDSCEYTLVYSLDVTPNAAWPTANLVPYSYRSTASTTTFDRVAYRLTLDGKWVWADMRTWTTDRTRLGVPSDWIWQRNVFDLDVRTNAATDPVAVTHASGGIEFWPNCYSRGPDGLYDAHDTLDGDDCHGSMQLFSGTHPVFAINNWVNGTTVALGIGTSPAPAEPDWTFAANAYSFQTRHLDVYVREVPGDCSVNPCAHGTCIPGPAPSCSCDAGYQGALCDDCAAEYTDRNGDGTCTSACVSGACSSFFGARSLSTGVHTMRLLDIGDVPMYVDADYASGGWVLIGRGRENWAWNDAGRGNPQDVAVGLGTPAAFTPTYLPSAAIQKLITTSPGSLDLTGMDFRIRRAASTTGDAYQEVHGHFINNTQWSWDFEANAPLVDLTFDASALGAGGTWQVTLNDTYGTTGNDQTRIFTYAWDYHNYEQGFNYGVYVSGGTDTSTNFFWETGNGENHPEPYTEVYLRSPRCWANTCNGHGSCDDSTGTIVCTCAAAYGGTRCESCAADYQDNDSNGSCLPACSPTACAPGETCLDQGGSIVCEVVDGTTCADILSKNPSAADGTYTIDPDGAGSNLPFSVQCDMTTNGGGWTVIDYQTFDDGTANGWSDPSVDTSSTCWWGPTLGGFGLFGAGASTQRTYDLLNIPHNEAYISMEFLALDSWDWESAYVEADGNIVYANSFTLYSGYSMCGSGNWADRYDDVAADIGHNNNSLTLYIWSTLDQDPYDESWGVDNVRVMVR